MRLSIIVPVLNEADGIEDFLFRLDGIRRRPDVELVVVDGGSSDDTVSLCQSATDVMIHSPPGRALQMNAGAAVARGRWLLFLHADTGLDRESTQALMSIADSDVPAWGRFDVRFDDSGVMFRLIAGLMNLRSRLVGLATGDQAMLVHRDMFHEAGAFPEVPLMEDLALSRILRRRRRPLCLGTKITTSARRWHKRGLWRTIFLMWFLRAAWMIGIDPRRLHDWYYPQPDPAIPHLLIFTRAPLAGQVKTRIAASAGNEAALRLHRQLLSHTVNTLARSRNWRSQLWLSELVADRQLDQLQRQYALSLHRQQGQDLGQRMAGAARASLQQGHPVVLVGTDCPLLNSAHIDNMLNLLRSGCDAVIVPAEDGGYVALALRRFSPAVFSNINWGTDRVYRQTTEALTRLQWKWRSLDALWDVDRPEDLERCRREVQMEVMA